MENLIPVEQVRKILKCKHTFDYYPAKSPEILLLTCRECSLNITAEVTAYNLNKEEMLEVK